MALRGHRDESTALLPPSDDRNIIRGDVNRGNFLQLLSLQRDSGDSNIDIYVNKRSKYTAPTVQNELLQLIADQLNASILRDIQSGKYFSVIADETTDISNTEQLCVALRYFDTETGKTEEKFLEFIPVHSIRGILFN